jgi:hypothetical protein
MKTTTLYIWILWLFLAFTTYTHPYIDALKLAGIAGFGSLTCLLLIVGYLETLKQKKHGK